MSDTKSELRQNIVSGDWILIAPGRGKRPSQFRATKTRKRSPVGSCAFENPEKAGSGGVILSVPDTKAWRLQVVPNRYPAVERSGIWVLNQGKKGPFSVLPGFGYHELLITRHHDHNFSQLTPKDAVRVLEAFRTRYINLAEDKNLKYVSMFHNWGPKAGASIYHPHYQILGIPVIPPGVRRSLDGSREYTKKNKACVHCSQLAWEQKQKKRILYKNKHAVSFMPFASKEPFEMRVFPRDHTPFFEDTDERVMSSIATALQKALKMLEKGLKHPDYNFFIHTAPTRNKSDFLHYHWHIEIIPRTNISAGFELGTDIQINPLDPDEGAAFLRKHA